ncbi:hypothetical protein SAMN00777080_2744 [Aquiflexum balticum DSM 16537]|uniref:Uncharacterized protein n=1 Tax=Aquiflexum balticum DSM 16537 TaxID=758820 RepID=A0A1W2H5I4_9BACT|nr:hypothetical protein [Aquiflexum balticum]SMD44129.1 hypothetical protein SAMN00777080_2744 [Aquiflexum balticum DSM 16537]
MKNHLLTLIAAFFMANVNVVLGQGNTTFMKISLPANYMWMDTDLRSNPPKVHMEFISERNILPQTGSLDPNVIGVWENVEYYSSGEFRNTTVNCFAITKDGKFKNYDTVSYSTTDNVSIYNRNNPSLLNIFLISTKNKFIYLKDPESGEEMMLGRYVAGPDYLQIELENGNKTLWRRR